jgi:muramidase (phage lysozyme)
MSMGAAGRAQMLTRSWDDVFQRVYQAYGAALNGEALAP